MSPLSWANSPAQLIGSLHGGPALERGRGFSFTVMSRLTDFAASQFAKSRAIIGGEALTVGGGEAVSAVAAEVDQSRDYESGGFDRSQSLTVVVSLPEWVAKYPLGDKDYLGKAATARGITWKVGGVVSGTSFVTIRLTTPRKGA